MNPKLYRTLLIALATGALLLGGGLLYWGGHHASKRVKVDQEYQKLVAKATKMEAAPYYPHEENVDYYKQDLKSYRGRIEGVKQSFKINPLEQLPLEDKTPEALHQEMQKLFEAFQAECAERGITWSVDVSGKVEGEDLLPEAEESVILYNRVCVTDWLLKRLLELDIRALKAFEFVSSKEVVSQQKTKSTLFRDPMVLEVRLQEQSLISLFKVLAESDYFIGIKSFRIESPEETSEDEDQESLLVKQALGRDALDVRILLECVTLAD